jgi:hypothetical protein
MFTKLNHLLVYILMFVYLFRHIQFIILHDKSESELKISAIQRKRNIEKKIDSDNRVKKRNIEPKKATDDRGIIVNRRFLDHFWSLV